MASKVLRALIMGAPGSGKGTIAKRIITDFDMKFISAGDILRSHVAQETGTRFMVSCTVLGSVRRSDCKVLKN